MYVTWAGEINLLFQLAEYQASSLQEALNPCVPPGCGILTAGGDEAERGLTA